MIAGRDRVVLVTGATGFLGTTLVQRLCAEGVRVHALVRPTSDRRPLSGLDLVWHAADLLDADGLLAAFGLAASDAREHGLPLDVVHAAAAISYRTRDAELLRRTNVAGTQAVLEASIAAGVRRLCHVSSVVAVGFARDASESLDEHAAFNGRRLRCAYVTTKRAAEALVQALRRPPECVIVCPGAIFGPSPHGSNTTRFLERVAAGGLARFAPPGSLAVVGVEDVADGVLRALAAGAAGRRYLLTESNLEHAELLVRATAELGVAPPRGRIPVSLWKALVLTAEGVDRVFPLREATPEALRLLGTHFRFDSRRAREELGWSPRPFAEVLQRTVQWMRMR